MRYHGGLHSGFEVIPECIRRLVIQTVAKYGIDLTRTSNAWNNFELLGKEAIELKKLGMDEVRKRYGGAKLSDEELLLRYYAGPEFVDALKNAPPRKEYVDALNPLIRLVEALGKKKLGHVYIRTGDFSLKMKK